MREPEPRTIPVAPPAERVPVISWPTPKGRLDVLFYVNVNTRTLPKNKSWEYGDPYTATADYPNHFLVFVSPTDNAGWSQWYYALARENQDDYNFEYASADMGGRRFQVVQRRYVNLREDFNPTTPAAGAAMPVTPGTLFQGLGYVLMGRTEERIGDERLDSLFVSELYTYVRKTSITEMGVDPLNGQELPKTTNFYYATEVVGSTGLTAAQLFAAPTNSYWGLQADGTQRTGQQISADWYVIDDERVVGGTFAGGEVTVASYDSNENYYWPPVLDTLEFMDWVRNDGGVDIYPRIVFDPEGYNGPCLTTTTLKWKATPHTIAKVDQMLPERIYYASPFFTLNIPESLHAAVTCQCDIGTEDPVYAPNVGSSRIFAATNYTTWPNSITAFDDQKPYRGGYLRTTVEINKPS